jgi:thiol-disulfide isomerase/thioredoxin
MKCILTIFGAAIFATSIAFAHSPLSLPDGFYVVPVRAQAPNVKLQDPDGKEVSLSAWRGKFIVLNIWATWCSPCIKEIPSLDRLSGQFENGRLEVVAVSQDKGGVAVTKPFLKRMGATHLRAFADSQARLSRELGVRGLPTTFILDSEGFVLGRMEGPADWDSDSIVASLRRLAK